MSTTTATFTDLLRHPKTVLESVESGFLRITRRDAEDLVILRAHDLENLVEGIKLASQIMRAAAQSGDMADALSTLYAWTGEFNEHERVEFGHEIEKLVYSAAELGHYESLIRAIAEWKETAAAYAQGIRTDDDLDWIDSPPRVPRP